MPEYSCTPAMDCATATYVGLQRRGHKPDIFSERDRGKSRHRVISKSHHQSDDQRVEPVKLAEHSKKRTSQAKDEHQNRDQDQRAATVFLHHATDKCVESAGFDNDTECRGAGHDHKNNVRRADAALIQRSKQAEKSSGGYFRFADLMVTSSNCDLSCSAVYIYCFIVKRTGGKRSTSESRSRPI